MLFSTYKDLQPLVALFSISATTSGVYGDYNHPALRRLPRLTVVCRSSAKESHLTIEIQRALVPFPPVGRETETQWQPMSGSPSAALKLASGAGVETPSLIRNPLINTTF